MIRSYNLCLVSDCATETHDYDNLPKPRHYRQNSVSSDKLRSKFKSSPNIRSERKPSGPDLIDSGPNPAGNVTISTHRRAGSLPRSVQRAMNPTDHHHPSPGSNLEYSDTRRLITSHTIPTNYDTNPGSPSYNHNLSNSSVFPVETANNQDPRDHHRRAGSLPRSRARIIRGSPSPGVSLSRTQSQPPHPNREFLAQSPQQNQQFDITVQPRARDNFFLQDMMSNFQSFQPSYSYRNNSSFYESNGSNFTVNDRDTDSTRLTESPKSAPYWAGSSRHFF